VRLALVLLVLGCVACVRPGAAQTGATPVPYTLPVEGGVIAYDVTGAGPAVVLIHGGFGDRRMWDRQVPALALRHRVVRFEFRGYGRSPAPTADYAALPDVLRLLDHLGIDQAALVGNSMGGALAVDFALVHPERVSRLVLVASVVGGFPFPEEDRERERQVVRTAADRGTEAAAELWLLHPMVAETRRDSAAGPLLRRMVLENREVWGIPFDRSDRLTPRALRRLGDVHVPTLVIVGALDTPANQAAGRALASGIPGARLVVLAGADHLPQLIRADTVNVLLREFLDRP